MNSSVGLSSVEGQCEWAWQIRCTGGKDWMKELLHFCPYPVSHCWLILLYTAQVFSLGGNVRFFFLKSKKIQKPLTNPSQTHHLPKHLKVSVWCQGENDLCNRKWFVFFFWPLFCLIWTACWPVVFCAGLEAADSKEEQSWLFAALPSNAGLQGKECCRLGLYWELYSKP